MFRVVIPAILAVALTACGGGGGSPSQPAVSNPVEYTTVASFANSDGIVPSIVVADFRGDGTQYVVVSGWNVASNRSPSVKIIKINSDSTAEDATVEVLGSEISVAVDYPVIADFNLDGIDDIFFPGFTDDANKLASNRSRAFFSRPGQSHVEVNVSGMTASHGTTAIDLNNDGWLDVINNMGEMWINTAGTGFSYQGRSEIGVALKVSGSAVCAGRLDNSGTTYLVATDNYDTGKVDSIVYTIDGTLKPIQAATLPVPYFDRNNLTVNEYSHDVSCRIVDFNNDGLNDIMIVSALTNDATSSGAQPATSMTQILLNRGGLVFEDVTDVAMVNYPLLTFSSYAPRIIDFNSDGKMDIWLQNTRDGSNQAWINNGSAVFSQTKVNEIVRIRDTYKNRVGGDASGIATPVKVNGKWNMVVTSTVNGRFNIGYVLTEWTF